MTGKVFQIISDIMDWPLSKINEDSSPDTISTWESLNHMKLVLALEEEFGIQFTDKQIVEMVDMRTIFRVLEQSTK